MDDVFELLQAVGPHLRDVVHHDHRVDPVGLLGPVLENVPQQLCMDRKLDKWTFLDQAKYYYVSLARWTNFQEVKKNE